MSNPRDIIQTAVDLMGERVLVHFNDGTGDRVLIGRPVGITNESFGAWVTFSMPGLGTKSILIEDIINLELET